jgi:hypothetical protein
MRLVIASAHHRAGWRNGVPSRNRYQPHVSKGDINL